MWTTIKLAISTLTNLFDNGYIVRWLHGWNFLGKKREKEKNSLPPILV